ncbi:mechanosensitive ion channel family protein [Alsobacter soli]|uniref:Small-conductance mechanosensitive channel n=1 Tax=Alsobacter soli TaxID=2109933 RepID=A0A2T1HZC8_9HYPH|nr:mechanosensitive ion channel family protein [Alsobacter soli]PSC07031.1 mechanosensitive ion channel family protein [Alsobacter soli]
MPAESHLSTAKIEELIKGFFWLLPNFALALGVAVVFWLVAWGVRAVVRRVFKRRGRDNLGELLAEFARWGVVLLGVLVISAIVFPSIKPADLLSTLGVGSIAIGFAFKDILQNWMAGLLILWRQPFRRGDQIIVGKYEGTVEHIEARATLIKTYDGRRVVIPNNDVYATSVIVNTAFPKRRSQIEIGIGYGDDLEKAREVILSTIKGVKGVEAEPPPEALAWELGASSVNLRIRWWTKSIRTDVVHTMARVVEALRNALTEAKIDLPFPTQTILLHDQTEDADKDRARHREGWPPGPGEKAANASSAAE